MTETAGTIGERMAEVERAIEVATPLYSRLTALLGPRVGDPSVEDTLIPSFRIQGPWFIRIEYMEAQFEARTKLRGRWGGSASQVIMLSLWHDGPEGDYASEVTDGTLMDLYVTAQGVYDTATDRYLTNDEIERLDSDLQPVFNGETPLISGSRFDLSETGDQTATETSTLEQPETPEARRQSDLQTIIADHGWEAVFQLTPPEVAERYSQLMQSLIAAAQALSAGPVTLGEGNTTYVALHRYTEALDLLDQYATDYGFWFGLPRAGRDAMNDALTQLRLDDGLTADERQLLIGLYREQDEKYVGDFIISLLDVAHIDYGTKPGGQLVHLSGEQLLTEWTKWVDMSDFAYRDNSLSGAERLAGYCRAASRILDEALNGV